MGAVSVTHGHSRVAQKQPHDLHGIHRSVHSGLIYPLQVGWGPAEPGTRLRLESGLFHEFCILLRAVSHQVHSFLGVARAWGWAGHEGSFQACARFAFAHILLAKAESMGKPEIKGWGGTLCPPRSHGKGVDVSHCHRDMKDQG